MKANVKIGVVGTGLMGLPLAQRLGSLEIPTMAFNRTAQKMEPLRQTKVEIAASAEDILSQCEVLLVMLTNADAIKSLLLQPDLSFPLFIPGRDALSFRWAPLLRATVERSGDGSRRRLSRSSRVGKYS